MGYIKASGIWYPAELGTIKRIDSMPLRPLFEAFTNSLEAIIQKKENSSVINNGEITISLFLNNNLLSKENRQLDFQKITIKDSGIGFNDSEFERFKNLRDNRKKPFNKGTGRVQFIHFFDKTTISSVYKDDSSSTGYKKRNITLSKNEAFLKENAIIHLDSEDEVTADKSYTILTFKSLLENKYLNYYSELNSEKIKSELVQHYLAWFCANRNTLPQITIKTFIANEEESSISIVSEDIPIPHSDKDFQVAYSQIKDSNIEKTSKSETFNLKSFVLPLNELTENKIILVSKEEIANELKLNILHRNDQINGNRYLFLLSGNYINERDSDARGNINIIKRDDFRKMNSDSFFTSEDILLEDVEETTNSTIVSLHEEITQKKEEKDRDIEELRKMFLLNKKTIKSLKFNIGDSDESVLKKVYEAEAKILAEKDVAMKQLFENIKSLTPNDKDYQSQLKTMIDKFVEIIPLQNRTSLSLYVARRKMVLETFQKILDKEMEKLKNGERIDEKLMHNLIFQQSSDKPEDSDLWLISDEYIHFKGFSNKEFKDTVIDGKKIFNKEFSEEESKYLNSIGEKRLKRKPDILLFPEEGKCIIIELKAPDANVSKHLTQINTYANLIRNYTIDDIKIVSFYGYLIGEAIEDRDVRGAVSTFEHSPHLDYWFCPSQKVIDFTDRLHGSIYTEVIKYTTLLKRAQLRNKIFIEKLEKV